MPTLASHEATVLVVDDDRDVGNWPWHVWKALVSRQNAEGGQAAIDLISGGAAIDLILIDIAMPEINGVQAIQAILKIRPDLPFLLYDGLRRP